jgi:hypothetical protein
VAYRISEVPSRGSPSTTDILSNHNWCFPSRFIRLPVDYTTAVLLLPR